MLNRRPTFCCLLVALALSWAAPRQAGATPGEVHVVTRDAVALRAGPGDGHRVLDRLDRDARVMEFERRGRWLRVQQMGTMGKMGWLPQRLVKPEPPPPAPPAPPVKPAEPPPPPIYIENWREIYIVKPRRARRRPPIHKPIRKPPVMVPRTDDPAPGTPSP